MPNNSLSLFLSFSFSKSAQMDSVCYPPTIFAEKYREGTRCHKFFCDTRDSIPEI